MRLAAGTPLLAILVFSGCSLVTATVVGTTAVATTAVKTTAKVTTATVTTTGKVTTAAITSSGDVAALSMESATRLARSGMVVLVDGSSGAITELPWKEGLELYQAARAGNLREGFKAARIFRGDRVIKAALKKATDGRLVLQDRDVIELTR